MIPRILVPLDGSATAEAILPQLRRLLKREESDVTLLRVVELNPALDVAYASVLSSLEEAARGYVGSVAADLQSRGIRARGAVEVGEAAHTILARAERERASLVAMSTHGRRGLARWLLGSVAEKVLRSSPVPVLLMRSFEPVDGGGYRPTPPEERPFRRILVPVDSGEPSLAAVPEAVSWARLFGAKATLLHVRERPADSPANASADEVLKKAAAMFESAGTAAQIERRVGEPQEKVDVALNILQHGWEGKFDLIAMATHGRAGLARWALGSVTEKLLRASRVPMLVVRSAAPQAVG